MAWEYKTKASGPYRDHDFELNVLGLEDWELVGLNVDSGGVHTYILKRPLLEEALEEHTASLKARAELIASQDAEEKRASEEFAAAQAIASARREKRVAEERRKREAAIVAAQAAAAAEELVEEENDE